MNNIKDNGITFNNLINPEFDTYSPNKRKSISINNILIEKFKLNDLEPHSRIIIIGHQHSGKTNLVIDILRSMMYLHKIHIFSPHEFKKLQYQSLRNDIMTPHFEITKEKYNQELINYPNLIDLNAECTVFDDVHLYKLYSDDKVKKLINYGKSTNNGSIFVSTHPTILSPEIRKKMDYIFIFNEPISFLHKRIYKYYGNPFKNYSQFKIFHDKISEDKYCCMVIKIGNNNNLSDEVFWYKANKN